MKAIKLNSKTYKVIQEKGAFVFYIDEKGKTKCILSNQVEIVESFDVERAELKVKSKKLNPANFMSKEQYEKTKYAKMSKDEFADFMQQEKMKNLPSSLR